MKFNKVCVFGKIGRASYKTRFNTWWRKNCLNSSGVFEWSIGAWTWFLFLPTSEEVMGTQSYVIYTSYSLILRQPTILYHRWQCGKHLENYIGVPDSITEPIKSLSQDTLDKQQLDGAHWKKLIYYDSRDIWVAEEVWYTKATSSRVGWCAFYRQTISGRIHQR